MQTKRIVIWVVLLVLLTAGCSGSAAAPVFKTPEDAITHYFAGVAQSDVQKIKQAFAIDEMSEKFKFDQYAARLRAFLPTLSQSPAEYPLYVEANKLQLSSQIFNRVKMFAYSLLSNEDVAEGATVVLGADASTRMQQFIEDVDPKRLAQLELKKIGLPDKQLMSNARYLENAAKLAGVYGADEATERVALFSFEGNDYYLGFSLLRYGDNWKISSQVSPLSGASALGTPQPITVEEFEKMINSD
jgi:hypothetical protein